MIKILFLSFFSSLLLGVFVEQVNATRGKSMSQIRDELRAHHAIEAEKALLSQQDQAFLKKIKESNEPFTAEIVAQYLQIAVEKGYVKVLEELFENQNIKSLINKEDVERLFKAALASNNKFVIEQLIHRPQYLSSENMDDVLRAAVEKNLLPRVKLLLSYVNGVKPSVRAVERALLSAAQEKKFEIVLFLISYECTVPPRSSSHETQQALRKAFLYAAQSQGTEPYIRKLLNSENVVRPQAALIAEEIIAVAKGFGAKFGDNSALNFIERVLTAELMFAGSHYKNQLYEELKKNQKMADSSKEVYYKKAMKILKPSFLSLLD